MIAFVAAAILFDFGWFRDQMCTLACPYGRLQNVMADPDTILVAYDEKRGEPRATQKRRARRGRGARGLRRLPAVRDHLPDRRRHPPRPAARVHRLRPVHRRLRHGDGPDRHGRPASSAARRSASSPAAPGASGGPACVVYLALLTLAWGTLAGLVITREDALVEILRGGREPYRLLPQGEVANQQRIRITNQPAGPQSFTVAVLSPPEAKLVLSDVPAARRAGASSARRTR